MARESLFRTAYSNSSTKKGRPLHRAAKNALHPKQSLMQSAAQIASVLTKRRQGADHGNATCAPLVDAQVFLQKRKETKQMDTHLALDLSGNTVAQAAALQAYYTTVVQHAHRGDPVSQEKIFLTVQVDTEHSLVFTITKQNLYIENSIVRVPGNRPLRLPDVTYNNINEKTSKTIFLQGEALKNALVFFQNAAQEHLEDYLQHFVILTFFLSEAARSHNAKEAAMQALNYDMYAQAHSNVSANELSNRMKWANHKPILSNWNTVLSAAGAPNDATFLSATILMTYRGLKLNNGTYRSVIENLDKMGF